LARFWQSQKPGFPLQFLVRASHALRDFRCNPWRGPRAHYAGNPEHAAKLPSGHFAAPAGRSRYFIVNLFFWVGDYTSNRLSCSKPEQKYMNGDCAYSHKTSLLSRNFTYYGL
jgi:hypothetical protein